MPQFTANPTRFDRIQELHLSREMGWEIRGRRQQSERAETKH